MVYSFDPDGNDKIEEFLGVLKEMELALYEPEDAEGMNLLDACRHMAKVQEQSAQKALGNASKEQFMKEAEVFGRLADLVEEIFVI